MALKINQKMTIIMLVFFLIPLFMFSATIYTTSSQKNDGLIINLAGRQRMLSQKMSKECLTYIHLTMMGDKTAEKTKVSLLNTMAVFETTLNSLMQSGLVPLSLDLQGEKRQVPAASGDSLSQLKQVSEQWLPFKEAVMRSIFSQKEEDILSVLNMNLALLSGMDKATTLMQQDAEARVATLFWVQVICQILAAIIVGFVIFWTRKTVVKPIIASVAFSKTLSEGDLRQTMVVSQKDEIGVLGNALNHTVQRLAKMIELINTDVITLNQSSTEMNTVSNEMAAVSDKTVGQANTVAAAAEETDSAMNSIAAAMEQAYTNVDTVASATEEMSSNIMNITGQTGDASNSMKSAVEQAQEALSQVSELGKAAEEIGMVSEAITSISDKTSLLALNATIEAARAGDAGKGFAVVASEIKELAKQTVHATGEIAGRLQGVQQSTDRTVTIIQQITEMIEKVSLIIFGIDESVEQQNVATREITQNIMQTSQGLKEITLNVSQTKESTGQVAQEISEVNESADQLSNSSAQVQRTAVQLNELSEHLRELVGEFKIQSQTDLA